MISYNLSHVHEIDPSFLDYLQDSSHMINTYDSLLHALKDLNRTQDKKPLVFIKTNCSNKGYACLYCDDEKYDNSIEDLEQIIQLHVFKRENIAKWKKDAQMSFF